MPEADFVCACGKRMRDACYGLLFYREVEGQRYCVLHCPVTDKVEPFRKALKAKLTAKDFNFDGVFFPEVADFCGIEFSAEADFSAATFSSDALFGDATFSAHADFSSATFSAVAFFRSTTFSATVWFSDVTFSSEAWFSEVTFSAEADFGFAIFSKTVKFTRTKWQGQVELFAARIADAMLFHDCHFENKAELRFDTATFDSPNRVSFHSVTLHPAWFVNVNVREFEFTNVTWDNRQDYPRELALLKQIRADELKAPDAPVNSTDLTTPNDEAMTRPPARATPHWKAERLLTVAYRNLAVNAEENHRYGEAADFRYAAMDLYVPNWDHPQWWRNPKWWSELSVWLVHHLYRLLSGYGERVGRAVMMLLLILTSFAVLYTQVGFEPKADKINPATKTCDWPNCPLAPGQAIAYSLSAALLQKPEPKPATTAAKACVALETLFAPLQGALLALAIRRRFMK